MTSHEGRTLIKIISSHLYLYPATTWKLAHCCEAVAEELCSLWDPPLLTASRGFRRPSSQCRGHGSYNPLAFSFKKAPKEQAYMAIKTFDGENEVGASMSHILDLGG